MAAVGDAIGVQPDDEPGPDADIENTPSTSQTSPHEAGSGAEEEDDEEEREPTLKYTKLTSHLSSVYRNGDSTSSFHLSGDKLIIGTHNGVVHVHELPSLQSLRQYRAHTSSITAISVSPSSQSYTTSPSEDKQKVPSNLQTTPKRESPQVSTASPRSPRPPVPATPSNSIYIATASIDGHVCVSSLVDSKDVTLRNYSRPVHAVALSPAFKTDRTYLSGGTAGTLICTIGGKAGISSEANTNSAAAVASGWLGTIGLGSNTGKDSVLHSGEGTVTSITWSTTGKFVAWNNEFGTRILRSHIDVSDADLAWKRIGHVPRPNRQNWDEMAGVWRARTQWIDHLCLESDSTEATATNGSTMSPSETTPKRPQSPSTASVRPARKRVERLLVGWGDTVWMVHVHGGGPPSGRSTTSMRAEIPHQFRFEECIISGLSMYTPSTLVALVFRTVDDEDNPISVGGEGKARRGRSNGLPPELRLIDLNSTGKDELDAETIKVSRCERLSFADYHLSTLYIPPAQSSVQSQPSRGTLEMLGGGLRDVGLSTTRLFSSGASVLSGSSSGDRTLAASGQTTTMRSPSKETTKDAPLALLSSGLKIFIQSPFDCVLAIRRDLSDQLSWQLTQEDYEAAWNLVRAHPETVAKTARSDSRPSTPSRSDHSLADFFDDSSSQSTLTVGRVNVTPREQQEAVEQELQRIGDLWINKLVEANDWPAAGAVAGKSLQSTQNWEDWITTFTQRGKFDEIALFIPTSQLKPPLPSYLYEVILSHYVMHDPLRLEELLGQWSSTLFEASAVATHIESYLESGAVSEKSTEDGVKGRDWKILLQSLARLYLTDARPSEAIRCYLKTKDAEAVMDIIKDYAKVDAIKDCIWDFVRLDTAPLQRPTGDGQDLISSSSPVTLLATAAVQGVVESSAVFSQLQAKAIASDPYLFLYFKQLWKPEELQDATGDRPSDGITRRSRFVDIDATETPSRALLGPYADTVVTLFAKYSQKLLNEFLKASRDYTFEHASEECRRRHYIPELVYLLQKTGQINSALHLIIDELGDVSLAIAFVRETNEESLWNDLLDYSMDKPEFIRGMLEDVGTSIDPVTLVNKIPQGLRVDGLKSSLTKLLRESEISWSISEGASKVLSREISIVMNQLRRRRERGVVFEVTSTIDDSSGSAPELRKAVQAPNKFSKGSCMSCGLRYDESEAEDFVTNDEYLIGFICGHVYHLSCLLDCIEDETNRTEIEKLHKDLVATDRGISTLSQTSSSVGNKIRNAQRIKGVLGSTGCLKCQDLKVIDGTALNDTQHVQ